MTSSQNGAKIEGTARISGKKKKTQIEPMSTDANASDGTMIYQHIQHNKRQRFGSKNKPEKDRVTTSIHKTLEHNFYDPQRKELHQTGLSVLHASSSDMVSNKGKIDNDSETEGSARFFEYADNHKLYDEKSAQYDCSLVSFESTGNTVLSSISDPESNLLVFIDNGADDMTIAVSNVSPECRISKSMRKNHMKYRHDFDIGNFLTLVSPSDATTDYIPSEF